MGKKERERRSFTFSSVQFVNLAQILLNKKIMNVSELGSYFWPHSRSFHVHLTFMEDMYVCMINPKLFVKKICKFF